MSTPEPVQDHAAIPGTPPAPAPALPGPPGPIRGLVADRLGGLPRAFWVLWTGSLVNRLGTMVVPFLAFYLSGARGLSVTQIGAVMAVAGAGSVVSQPLGGYLADRFGRRITLCGGMVATAVCMIVLGYVGTLPALVVAVFATGVSVDLYRPASGALVSDLVPADQRARAFGLLYWAINLGFACATSLGGLLAKHGFGLLFWIDALTCLGFAAVIWRGVPETVHVSTHRSRGDDGFVTVLKDRAMLAYAVISLSYLFVYLQAYTTLALAMRHDGLSPAAYGTAIAINGLVIVIVQPLVVRWLTERDRTRVLAAGMAVVGLGFGLSAVATTAVMYAGTVVIWTFGEIVVASVAQAIVADLAPAHLRGRYQGLYGVAWAVASLIAPLGGTALLAHGKLVIWPVCAGLAVLAAAGQLLLGPAIRRRAAAVRSPVPG